jgi:hypothetical protein
MTLIRPSGEAWHIISINYFIYFLSKEIGGRNISLILSSYHMLQAYDIEEIVSMIFQVKNKFTRIQLQIWFSTCSFARQYEEL